MASIPTTQKALKSIRGNKAAVLEAPVPEIRSDELLVKTNVLALNPSDWKVITFIDHPDITIGCDYAGEVVKVVDAVTKPWKVGDRVAGTANGNNPMRHDGGAFAQYIAVKGDVQMKVPDNFSMEQSATLGVGIATVGQGLYQSLQLPWPTTPTTKPFPILIYGGSTATGTLGIQFAKLSGLQVLATSSPHNFDMLKKLGADHVFDHTKPTCGAEIREFTKNKLFYVWDCFAEGDSPKICGQALSTEKDADGNPPIYGSLGVDPTGRDDVKFVTTMAYTIFNEPFIRGPYSIPASKEDFEFAKKFITLAEQLLAEGKITPHRTEVRSGGMEAIPQGLEDLKTRKVSGAKLIYSLD